MPELPDLQAFSSNLNKILKGKKVEHIKVPVAKKLNVPVAELQKALEGHAVKQVYRDGKELHISFNNDAVLGLHLMLHGGLHLFDGNNENKHTIIELQFSDETGLALTDWQTAATPTLNPATDKAPDALSDEMTFEYLKGKLQTKAIVKNVLLDQKKIRGIGNAYADEILWDARISPFSVGSKIPDKAIKALLKSIHGVLMHAEKEILKSNPDIITGEVRDFMLIHNFNKKTSPGGATIQHNVAGGRKTYFTDEQELYE